MIKSNIYNMSLKKTHYLFLFASMFFVGNKSYSQREIHPLEPMFTYDYALRYHRNEGVREYIKDKLCVSSKLYFIENFKAPLGVKSIEVNTDERINISFSIDFKHMEEMFKTIYYYNSETGLLEKRVQVKPEPANENEVVTEYNYTTKNDSIIITTSHNEEYIFNESSGNLLRIVNKCKDTIDLKYSKKHKNQVVQINSPLRKVEEKFIYGHDNVIYDNSFSSYINRNRYYTPSKDTLKMYDVFIHPEHDTISSVINGATMKTYRARVRSNKYLIHVYSFERLYYLFDDNKRLIELHREYENPNLVVPYYTTSPKLRKEILRRTNTTHKKLNCRTWGYYYNFRKKNYYSFRKQVQGLFSIKNNGSIYYKNIPVIIYNYY